MTLAYNDLLSVYEGKDQTESYTYGLNRLHAYLKDGTNETYSYDHLGSIVGLQDSRGKLKEAYRYDEFGILDKSTPQSNRLAVNFGYTGYPNEGNGLSFAQARYYNPEIGRFISKDTYEGEINDPRTLNLYGYVANNPLRYVDPSGHFAFETSDYIELGILLNDAREKTNSNRKNFNYQLHKDFLQNRYDFYSIMGENRYNYLYDLLTGTSAYTNNAGNSDWAREQLVSAYFKSKEAEYLALLAMGFIPGGSGGKRNVVNKTSKGTGEVMSPAQAAKKITNADRTGTALSKSDPGHRSASFPSEAQLSKGSTFNVTGGDGVQRTLLQTNGELNGKSGIYEYMIQPNGTVSHQRFIEGGKINGVPNQKVK